MPDILDAIQDLGGIAAPSQSRFANKGDYDGFREAFTGPARVLIRSTGGNPPDKLVQALTDTEGGAGQIFRLESTSDLYDAVAAAVESREAARKQFRQQMQDEVFLESAVRGRRSGCARPVETAILAPGDRFTVRREPCTVRRRDEASGEISLRCEDRFKTQVLPPGAFFPDKCAVMKAPAANPAQRFIDIFDFEKDRWRVMENGNHGGYFYAYNQDFGWQPTNWGQVHINFPNGEIKKLKQFFAEVGHPAPPFRLNPARRRNPAGDLFAAPESVAEQRARLDREAAGAERKRQRAEMEARRAAPLTGRSVNTTGELFDPLAVDAPLFSLKRPNPARPRPNVVDRRGVRLFAERRRGAWEIRTNRRGGLVLARGLSDGQVKTWARRHGYTPKRTA